MNRRFVTPEIVGEVRRIDKNGEEHERQDCIVGIENQEGGTITLDLRCLRPIRVNDRESIMVSLDISELLGALAENLRDKVKT